MIEDVIKKVREIANNLGEDWHFIDSKRDNINNRFSIIYVHNPVLKIFIYGSKGELNLKSNKHCITLLFHSFYRMNKISINYNLNLLNIDAEKIAKKINSKLITPNEDKINKLLETIPASYDLR